MTKRLPWLAALGAGLALSPVALTDVTVVGTQGPSTQSTPYLVPTAAGARAVSILTVGESAAPKLDGITPYRMIGLPDGLGAFDNGDGTFTLLANHELGSTAGTARAHGGIGAAVSAWKIDRSSLAVISGGDLIRTVMTWDYVNQKWAPSTTTAFNRFCSADLAAPTAFWNAATGKGTRERLFMDGEENSGGRAVVHVATGPNAGVSYEFPRMGRDAWENVVACPYAQDKTIVIGDDDTSSPGGQVYVYIGTKTATGNDMQRAGLANGSLYCVIANATRNEDRTTGVGIAKGGSAAFTLAALADQSLTATNTETAADGVNATEFLRPEDGCWDPSHPADYYFVTTDRFDQVKNASGATVGRSRLWRLRFADIANPESGGMISMLLDGTEPHNMFDNLVVTKTGFIYLQEDVGGNAWNGKIWRYEIATGTFTEAFHHDTARFGSESIAVTPPFNNDEEASGIIDASDILGTGWFLTSDQAHYSPGDAELVEGGQFMALYDPASAAAPTLTGDVTATPTQAVLGQTVTFTASASAPGDGALTYAWTFGDGAQGSGATATHSYAAAGTFHAVCTITHTATGLTAQDSVDVMVSRPALGVSLQITLNFAADGKDALVLGADLFIPAGFDPEDKEISVDVGGVSRSFTLDASGRGPSGDGTCQLSIKRAHGVVGAQRARLTMALKNASLQSALSDFGLEDDDVTGSKVSLPVEIVFDGKTYESVVDLLYTAKAGKKGSAK